ncbi:hypothetical protein T12_5343 [Trichinella patagoniensis]|uniref:Uncharacterized protein n=1 Tax=Trichinella patagoniensis TaxID=990121 RepID=A0A0V0YUC7_9BILA|nr:hypothetical protein T12_5343 [Trichinella patagoniensis]
MLFNSSLSCPIVLSLKTQPAQLSKWSLEASVSSLFLMSREIFSKEVINHILGTTHTTRIKRINPCLSITASSHNAAESRLD